MKVCGWESGRDVLESLFMGLVFVAFVFAAGFIEAM